MKANGDTMKGRVFGGRTLAAVLVSKAIPSARSFAAFRIMADLVRYRSLLLALLVRELKARYRGSVLGFAWTFLNPLLLMAVYALVFRYYMRIAVPNYALFLLTGLLPWTWFSSSLAAGTNAIVGGSSLVTKSLFPSEILPAVVVLSNMVNFALSIPILTLVGWACGVSFSLLGWLWLLPVMVLQCVLTFGLVLSVAALNVHYRDVQHAVENLLLLWFFLTPIVYPASQVPERLRPLIWVNPMALFTGIYRDIFVVPAWPGLEPFGVLAAWSLASILVGAKVFDVYRETFPELV
jgi:lipopolysaccharide transport system permease protein